jgi:hypothetical protein
MTNQGLQKFPPEAKAILYDILGPGASALIEGATAWDQAAKLPVSQTDLHTIVQGRDVVLRVRNQSGATIAAGRAVTITGYASSLPLIGLATPATDAGSRVAGLTMGSIANNANGYIMVRGVLNGVSTTGLTVGAPFYLAASGLYQATAPARPELAVSLGRVLVLGGSGSVWVNCRHEPVDALGANFAVATPARSLDSTFQPHPTRPVQVTYTIYVNTGSVGAAGSAEARVELLSDAASPPTQRRGVVMTKLTRSSLAVGTSANENMATITYKVPAGHNVRLASTLTGSATAVLSEVVEEIL